MLERLATLRDKRDRDGGFTLIELLVVVVIIGILIAIAIPLYLNYRKGANDKAAMSDLRAAITALEQCNSDNSKYPNTVNADGTMSTDCSQVVKLSAGTKLHYFPLTGAGSDVVNYVLTSTNTLGSTNSAGSPSKYYCYASSVGGKVQTISADKSVGDTSC